MYLKTPKIVSVCIFAIVLAMLVCVLHEQGVAQSQHPLADTLQRKMKRYQQLHPASMLFTHFDKTIYTNNENVWFTAYLLNCSNYSQHHTLSVSLVNDIDRSIALQEKFAMSGGVGFGNMLLPDSIAPGNYTFMVYTNRVVGNKPEAIFEQPITIKTGAPPAFKAILYLKDTVSSSLSQSRQVVVSVTGADYLPVANAAISYKLAGKDTSVLDGRARTDKAGQYIIVMPPGKNMVKVLIKDKKASQYLYLSLPDKSETAQVKFYPEGGYLVNNQASKVGWEVTKPNGEPLKVTGVLYQGNTATDTIYTDAYGMGKFMLYPLTDQYYTLKLKGISQKDTVYKLPAILPSGLVLTVRNPLANDTLHIQLRCNEGGKYVLNVHNYMQQFSCTPVQVKSNSPLRVVVALNDMPRGLAEITITDSLGRPLAERLFFAHYDQQNKLNIQLSKSTYITREKVSLKVKLNFNGAVNSTGIVSVACVQDNRFEMKKAQDIESYFYLKSAVGVLPLRDRYMGYTANDKSYLENVLLIKGWRKYTWQDMLATNTADTSLQQSSLTLTGKITNNGKQLHKPGVFVLARDSSSQIITTDANGNFVLSRDELLTQQDKMVKFVIPTKDDYIFSVNDPYKVINNNLTSTFRPQSYETSVSTLNTESFAIKGLERAIQLKEVKVVARRDNSFWGVPGGTNRCGDYVCRFNILNCPNHVTDYHTLPVVGKTYRINGMSAVYRGCSEENAAALKTIHGIYLAKQFYGSDYAVANPTEPEYNSTIFWRHLVSINSEKETEMSFYTSDITGRFRIVIQGITDDAVVYGESFINVKKP